MKLVEFEWSVEFALHWRVLTIIHTTNSNSNSSSFQKIPCKTFWKAKKKNMVCRLLESQNGIWLILYSLWRVIRSIASKQIFKLDV